MLEAQLSLVTTETVAENVGLVNMHSKIARDVMRLSAQLRLTPRSRMEQSKRTNSTSIRNTDPGGKIWDLGQRS